ASPGFMVKPSPVSTSGSCADVSHAPFAPRQMVCGPPTPTGSVKCTACPALMVRLVMLKSPADILTSFGAVELCPQAASPSIKASMRSKDASEDSEDGKDTMRIFIASFPFRYTHLPEMDGTSGYRLRTSSQMPSQSA